jgi:single-strand DNA-binding protein
LAGSFNRCTFVGNLTKDPETRDAGGKQVAKFSLAINRKSKQGDETMYIDVVAWERLSEICQQYLRKGMSVLIEGRLAIRKYDDRDGNKRTAVEIVANDMQMLDSKARDGNGNGGGSYASAGARSTSSSGVGYGGGSGAGSFDDDGGDDEIPF